MMQSGKLSRRQFVTTAAAAAAGSALLPKALAASGLQDPVVNTVVKDGKVSEAYGTHLYPESYVIDRLGKVIAKFEGQPDEQLQAAEGSG